MNKTKVLVLDGLSQIPLGREIAESIKTLNADVDYHDLRALNNSVAYQLKSALHKVIYKNSLLHKFENHALTSVVNAVRPTHIIVISYIYKYIDPKFLKALADQMGIRLFLYDTDSCNLYEKRTEFEYFLDMELPIYDEIFSFSKVMTKFFVETKSLPAFYLPYGANPVSISHDWANAHVGEAIFVGTCDVRRIFLLENIRDRVNIYGSKWARYAGLMTPELRGRVDDRKIWGSALQALLMQHSMILNINNINFHGLETGVNLRVFEALSLRCFLLTEHSEEIASLFAIGKEVETFRDAKELREKVEYYSQNPKERKEIANAGYQAFLSSHTWSHRVADMYSRILH